MSLTLVAEGLQLGDKIRNRIAAGAAVCEVAADEMPVWLAAEVGNGAVVAAFVSEQCGVAVLEGGRTVVRRAPKA